MLRIRSQAPKGLQFTRAWDRGRGHLQEGTKELLGVIEMFGILVVVLVTTPECVCPNTRTVQ